eukprot:2859458-Prymnesium_polylepis.1
MSVCAVREPICAFVRRNCPARPDHRETVAKPPCRLRKARIVHAETRCVSLPPDARVQSGLRTS